MEYRFLGSSGLPVSVLSFGSWVTFGQQFGEDTAYDCMKTAYDAGVNFFDNAEGYASGQSETIMGSVVKKAGWKRSDLVVSTKIFWGGRGPNDSGLSREHLIPPQMEQPQYNMFHRERVEKEYAPLYIEFGLGTTIWSPLASGLLTGKYNAGIPEGTRATLPGYEWLRQRFESDEARRNLEKVKQLRNTWKSFPTFMLSQAALSIVT